MSVLGLGLGRADIPPRDPPPSKGCSVDAGAGATAGVTLAAAVILGLFILRWRAARVR